MDNKSFTHEVVNYKDNKHVRFFQSFERAELYADSVDRSRSFLKINKT